MSEQTWILIAELERQAWARSWSGVKRARKAIEDAIGKRPAGLTTSFDTIRPKPPVAGDRQTP